MLPPNWFWCHACFPELFRFAKKLLAFRTVFRRYSYAVPWNALVPDLVLILITPPVYLPNSAVLLCVWTLNSWMLSWSITSSTALPYDVFVDTPSTRTDDWLELPPPIWKLPAA